MRRVLSELVVVADGVIVGGGELLSYITSRPT